MKCRNCKTKSLKKIIFLGSQPLSGIFIKKKTQKIEKKFSLDLFFCTKCKLVQLGKNANPSKMFGGSYGYQSSISKLMTSHLKNIYNNIRKKNLINHNSTILDIGSNDGTFLNFFKKTNKVYGIDPTSKRFKNFYKPNIKRINDFFSFKNVKKRFKNCSQKFDFISSFAMFYDVNDPNAFCKDIYKLLKPNGVWALELSYFPLLLKNLTYDQICHEHVTYYTLEVFKKIAEQNNFKIFYVSFNEINGGSIQIYCAKKSSNIKIYSSNLINKTLKDEKNIIMASFKKFNKRIQNLKNKIQSFLKKNKKKIIYGYGASTKGNIILNYCNIKKENLKFVCDANESKINLLTPGTNIKIIGKSLMRKHRPDYLFVLIWSFRKEVINEEIKYLKSGGKLIFPLPKFHIVNKKNYKKFLKKGFEEQSYSY